MAFLPMPQERFALFSELLGLTAPTASGPDRWAEAFLPHADALAKRIEAFVLTRPQLRIILQNQPEGRLAANWRGWYTLLFTAGVGKELMDHVWSSGQAHVIHNVDHRYVNLAYNLARAFLHETAMAHLPLEEQPVAMCAMDRAVDLCLLVETDAYVSFATQCELEVIQGISHQVRNPVAVIGGNARRLLKNNISPEDIRESAEVILSEAVRLERMAKNVNAYMDVTQHQAAVTRTELAPLLKAAAHKARIAEKLPEDVFRVYIDPQAAVLSGDPMELCILFSCLLENAFQFADSQAPNVSVTAVPSPGRDGFATITIINNGVSFDLGTTGKAFSPFHSSSPTATGFGLPMARVIASKYFGNITLAPLPGHGTRCVVTLPLYTGD